MILSLFLVASPARALQIDNYSAAANDRFANSPSFIAVQFNLSGISRASNNAWVTMIAPNVFVAANHFAPADGNTVTFFLTNDPSGPSVTRTVSGARQRIGSTDIFLGTLDAPLPEGYATYPCPTETATDSTAWSATPYWNASVYHFGFSPGNYTANQDVAVGRNVTDRWHGNHTIGSSTTWAFGAMADPVGAPNYQTHETKIETGDSGAPVFYHAGNSTLRLLGLSWGKGTYGNGSVSNIFTYLGNYQSEVASFLSTNALPHQPLAPSNLSATRISSSRVDLSWTDNSAVETGYVLERSTDGSSWSALANLSANSTSYSDTAAPSGSAHYRVKAVATNPVGTAASAFVSFSVTATEFYDIYVLAGQSNAAGYDTNISRLPAPYASLATPNTAVDFLYWYQRHQSATVHQTTAFAPLAARNITTNGETSGEFGLELSLGQSLAANTPSNARPVIVKVTLGSSGLYQMTNGQKDWNAATTGNGSMAQILLNKVQQAISLVPSGSTPRIRGFIWVQGERESDAAAPEWTLAKNQAYQSNLQGLLDLFKSTFAAHGANDARIVIVQTLQRRGAFEDNSNNQTFNANVRAAQKAVALSEPHGRLIAIDDFRQNDGSDTAPLTDSNNVHFLSGEVVQLGFRVADALLAAPGDALTYRGAFVNTSLPLGDRALGAQLGPVPRKVAWTASLSSNGSAITATSGTSLAAVATTASKENQRGYFSCNGGLNVVHNPNTTRSAVLLRAPITEALPVVETPFTLNRLQSVTFDFGPWNLNTALRLAVKVNGTWYLRANTLEATQAVTTGGNFTTQATTLTQTFDRTAANWRVLPFTPGSAFTAAPATLDAPATDLPAFGEVEEFGWYIFSKNTPASTSITHATGPIASRLQHFAITYTPPLYSVSYDANGATSGSAPAAQTKTRGVPLTLASNSGNLTRTGFDFTGWNTAADGNGTAYAAGASYTADAPLVVYARWQPQPNFQGWIASEYPELTGSDAAPLADPDGDGVANLLEYAFGGVPTTPGTAVLPTGATTTHSGQQRLALDFTPANLDGLRYIIEASSDLPEWSEQSDITALLEEGQPYRHTDSANLATTPRRFLRLRVVAEP